MLHLLVHSKEVRGTESMALKAEHIFRLHSQQIFLGRICFRGSIPVMSKCYSMGFSRR